jgi:hypothetical protein
MLLFRAAGASHWWNRPAGMGGNEAGLMGYAPLRGTNPSNQMWPV